MAVASTNAWKVDIEETIINAIRSEFKAHYLYSVLVIIK